LDKSSPSNPLKAPANQKMKALPPAHLTGGMEAPDGTITKGSFTRGVYTEEQQARLGVDENGKKKGGEEKFDLESEDDDDDDNAGVGADNSQNAASSGATGSTTTPARPTSIKTGLTKGGPSGYAATPGGTRKRWHSFSFIEDVTATMEGPSSFGVQLRGPHVAGKGHEIRGCHVVGFANGKDRAAPGCEAIKIDMTLVEINGEDVTKYSIDRVRELLQGRPITTRWIMFGWEDPCPDTPDLHF
jgi:hypothetical protein